MDDMYKSFSIGFQNLTSTAAQYVRGRDEEEFGHHGTNHENNSASSSVMNKEINGTPNKELTHVEYATLAAEAEQKYLALLAIVEKLRLDVEHETKEQEILDKESIVIEAELAEIRKEAWCLEEELASLQSEAMTVREETKETTNLIQSTIQQRDEFREQVMKLQDEMDYMQVEQYKHQAEQEQLQFFEKQSQNLITNLLMNNHELMLQKETEEIALRKAQEEIEALELQVKNMEQEKEDLIKEQSQAQRFEKEAQEKEFLLIMEQERLKNEAANQKTVINNSNNQRWGSFGKFLKRGSNNGHFSSSKSVGGGRDLDNYSVNASICSAPVQRNSSSKYKASFLSSISSINNRNNCAETEESDSTSHTPRHHDYTSF